VWRWRTDEAPELRKRGLHARAVRRGWRLGGGATYVVTSSSQIKNGAVRNADVRKGTLEANRLSESARVELRSG
jgi:hypothetical protein